MTAKYSRFMKRDTMYADTNLCEERYSELLTNDRLIIYGICDIFCDGFWALDNGLWFVDMMVGTFI